LVGFDPSRDGFFWFAGQGGFGIQMAPALARVGAFLVLRNESDPLLGEFGFSPNALSPLRLSLTAANRAQSTSHPICQTE
jgi:D-arginine dehydrogenase